jgi:hypothetical protein
MALPNLKSGVQQNVRLTETQLEKHLSWSVRGESGLDERLEGLDCFHMGTMDAVHAAQSP